MRRFFTGDLKAPVLGFPRFPWGEAAYLRTQISRITQSTVLIPRGMFNMEEEAEEGEGGLVKVCCVPSFQNSTNTSERLIASVHR